MCRVCLPPEPRLEETPFLLLHTFGTASSERRVYLLEYFELYKISSLAIKGFVSEENVSDIDMESNFL